MAVALLSHNVETVKMLLAHPACDDSVLGAKDGHGRTLLHMACDGAASIFAGGEEMPPETRAALIDALLPRMSGSLEVGLALIGCQKGKKGGGEREEREECC